MKSIDTTNDPHNKQIIMLTEMRRFYARYKGYGLPLARGATEIIAPMVGILNMFDGQAAVLREAIDKFEKVALNEAEYDLPPYVNPTGEDITQLILCDLDEIVFKYKDYDFAFSKYACKVLSQIWTCYLTQRNDSLKQAAEEYITQMDMN